MAAPLCSFAVLPFTTKYLSTDQYGTISSIQVFLNYLMCLVGFCAPAHFTREYYQTKNINRLTSCVFIIFLCSLLFIALLVFTFNFQLQALFDVVPEYLFIGILICALLSFINFNLLYLRLSDSYITFSILTIIQPLTFLILYLIFLKLDFGVYAFINANLLTAFLFFGICVRIFFKKNLLKIKFDFSELKNSLNYGLRLLPHSFFGVLAVSIDKLIVLKLLSLTTLGIYTLAFSIASVVKVFEGAIYSVYQPWLFKNFSSSKKNLRKIVRISLIYIASILIFSVFLNISIYITFHNIIDSKFSSSLDLIPYFTVGYFINSLYTINNQILLFYKKTFTISLISGLSVIAGSILAYYLISKYGLSGSIYAFLITMSFRLILTLYFSYKIFYNKISTDLQNV